MRKFSENYILHGDVSDTGHIAQQNMTASKQKQTPHVHDMKGKCPATWFSDKNMSYLSSDTIDRP